MRTLILALALLALAGCRKRLVLHVERGALTGDYMISTPKGICAYGPDLQAALARCRKAGK
jgi:hypothetical protein